MDNCLLSSNEVKEINTIEGNAIKAIIGLNKEMRTTPLINALDIEPTNIKIARNQIGLFLRLCENDFTKHILTDSHKEFPDDSLIKDFVTLTNVNYKTDGDLAALCDALKRSSTSIYTTQ